VKHLDMPLKPETIWRIINRIETGNLRKNAFPGGDLMITAQFDFTPLQTQLRKPVALLAQNRDDAKISPAAQSDSGDEIALRSTSIADDLGRIKDWHTSAK